MDPIRIIIQTIFEVPKVIIKSAYKVPEVIVETTGQGGCAGVIVGPIIVILLIWAAIRGCTYVVETHVIKGINPNYVTSFEKAEKEAKEKEAQRREEQARQEMLKPRNIMRRAEAYLHYKEVKLYAYDLYRMGDHIWISGNVVSNSVSHPAVIFSKDGGKEWKVLSTLDEKDHYSHPSLITFVDKDEGFLSVGYPSSNLYQTRDGGKNWGFILTTKKLGRGMVYYPIEKIRAKNSQCIGVDLFNPGCSTSIETSDGGKHWTFLENSRAVAWTNNRGLTWEIEAGRVLP